MCKCDWRHWGRDRRCNPILTNINFEHKNMGKEPFPGSQMGKSGNLPIKGTVQRGLYQKAVPVLKNTFIWRAMPCSLVELYQCFRGMFSMSSCQKVLFIATFLVLKKFYVSLCCEWEVILLTWRCFYFKHCVKNSMCSHQIKRNIKKALQFWNKYLASQGQYSPLNHWQVLAQSALSHTEKCECSATLLW